MTPPGAADQGRDGVEMLLVVADREVVRLLEAAVDAMQGAPYDVLPLQDLDEALVLVGVDQPAVALVQVEDDPSSATTDVARFRMAAEDVPVVAITGSDDVALGARLVAAGAQDFLAIPDISEAVVRRTLRHARERHRLLGSLEQLVITDHLTGLYNRRGLELIGRTLLQDARRHHKEIAILFADLDGLKVVNDTAGHHAGDALIQSAARLLREELRSSDVLARLGGDEFAALLIDADREAVSRRLRSALATHPDRRLSMSFAMVTAAAPHASLASLMDAADAAMYEQKRARKAGRA